MGHTRKYSSVLSNVFPVCYNSFQLHQLVKLDFLNGIWGGIRNTLGENGENKLCKSILLLLWNLPFSSAVVASSV